MSETKPSTVGIETIEIDPTGRQIAARARTADLLSQRREDIEDEMCGLGDDYVPVYEASSPMIRPMCTS